MHRALVASLLGFVLLLPPAGVAAGEDAALGTVRAFQASLIAAMKSGPALGYDARRAQLAPVVTSAFDFPTITRLVLGKHWRRLTSAQRERARKVLEGLAVATLAAQFKRYAGEVFEAQGASPLGKGRMRVRSVFRTSSGGIIPVDYTLRSSDRGWRIVNVWFEGVSSNLIHRREFGAVIRRDGFEALLDQLREKIEAQAEIG